MFEGTGVTVYGTVIGTNSGTNAMGGTVIQPLVKADIVYFEDQRGKRVIAFNAVSRAASGRLRADRPVLAPASCARSSPRGTATLDPGAIILSDTEDPAWETPTEGARR